MSKIVVRLADESGSSETLLFDTENEGLTTESGEEPTIQARNLACAIGRHAWLGGVCVNCGKKK